VVAALGEQAQLRGKQREREQDECPAFVADHV
jgi:hypothetical protein